MNTQEIYQNMTKGKWGIERDTDWWNARPNEVFLNAAISEADANLICLMKRETIDRGINPESVEKLYKLLDEAKNMIGALSNYLPVGNYSAEKKADYKIQEIEEALTASKLDNNG